MTEISKALIAERKRRRLTQIQASAELGIKQVSLSSWEVGRRIPDVDPRRLASFLHHDDGTAWTVDEVLDILARDREARQQPP